MTWAWWKLLFFCTLVKLGRSDLIMSNCNDESLSQNTANECLQLFNEVKAAAVKSDTNLYLLHNLFFPVVDTAPSIANISYVVTFNNSNSQELQPCPGLDVNSTLDIAKTHYYTFGWSVSGAYTVVHPALLRMLQPQFPFVVLLIVQQLSKDIENKDFNALLWDGLKQLSGVELNLVDITLKCVPSDAQLQGTLSGITSVVKDLAELSGRDDRVIDDRSNNGFVITDLDILDDKVNKKSSEVFTITAVPCSCTLTLIFVLILYFYCCSSKRHRVAFKPVYKAVVLALMLWSMSEILCDLGMFICWVRHHKHAPFFFFFKHGVIIALILFVIIYIGCYSCIMCCCTGRYENLSDNVFVARAFPVIICFGVLFIYNIIPVILLAVVYPVWVSSTLLFITSVFFVSSLLFIHLYKLSRFNDKHIRRLNCVLLTVSAILFIIGMLLFVVLFQYTVINGKGVASSGTMTHFILSYLPSVLVSILGWMLPAVLVGRESDSTSE